MDFLLKHEETINRALWERVPQWLARVSPLWGHATADGRYLLKFSGIAALLPVVLFIFGVFCGATHFFVDQPLYMSVIPMVALFVLITFISGGLGFAAIIGYAAGYLLLFDHLILIKEMYHGFTLREYGFQIYVGIFFNLLIFICLTCVPMIARSLSVAAANQICEGLPQEVRASAHRMIWLATHVAMVTLFMLVWIQMVTLGAFSYYLWWDRLHNVWDFEQFINATLLGWHPLLWAAWAGMILRIFLEAVLSALPGNSPEELTLPPPFAIYKKIPLSAKSILAAGFMFLVLQGYAADERSLWGYLAAGLLGLYLLRDGLEVWLHKWFAVIERVPLAYRLIGLFMVMGFCVHHLTEYIADNVYTRTPEPHVILLSIIICLPMAFLLISKNEPHSAQPPPTAPFWLKPLAALLRKTGVPQAIRKRLTRAAPALLLFAALGITTSALAHHCFQGCESCDYFTWFFNWLAGGTAGTAGGLAGSNNGGERSNVRTFSSYKSPIVGSLTGANSRQSAAVPAAAIPAVITAITRIVAAANKISRILRASRSDSDVAPPTPAPVLQNENAEKQENRPKDKGKPDNKTQQSKPTDAPPGTIPIDKAKKKFGLDKEKIHNIKDGVAAGPSDWTGITPNGDVITTDTDGTTINHGHIDLF